MKWLLTHCVALLAIHAVAGTASPQELEMIRLERRYLECNRVASTQRLSSGTVAACSVIAQRLLTQRFGGDFERLLQWSRTARDTSDAASAPFEVARAHYDAGHFTEAYALFVQLADCGHREAARIALQMHRLGSSVYGLDFAAHPQQLMRWQIVLSAEPHDDSGGCTAA